MSLRTTIVIALASVAANALPVQNEVIAYTKYSGKNAYEGHGGTPMGGLVIPHITVQKCKSLCDDNPACQCVTYQTADVPGSPADTCFLRTDCSPTNFVEQDQYDTYVNFRACPAVVTEPEHFVACYQTNQTAKVSGLSGQVWPPTFDNKTFIGSGKGPGPLAFVAGDDSLETLLRVNKDRYGAVKDQQFTEAEAGYRLTAAMTSLVGFPRSLLLSSNPTNYDFFVFKSSAVFKSSSAVSMFGSEQPVVPTFSFFAEFVKSISGFEIPLDLTRDLVAAYAEQPNPMTAFSKVAGCDEEKVRAFEYGVRKSPTDFTEALVAKLLDAGCSENFKHVYNTALDAYKASPSAFFGKQCVTYFVDRFKNREFDLAADSLRALYAFCFDASPLFTGNGFSFSGMVNANNEVAFAATTFSQQLTSREFVVPLTNTADLDDFKVLTFPALPSIVTTAKVNPSNPSGPKEFNREFYAFLEQGFFPAAIPNPVP